MIFYDCNSVGTYKDIWLSIIYLFRGGLNLPGTDPYFTYDLFGTGERPRNFIDDFPNSHRFQSF